jgi:hypothetical protein
MSNKFRCTFYDFGAPGTVAPYVLTQQVRSTNLPSWTMGQQPLYAYVSIVYIATRGEWAEMQMRFSDDITSGVYKIVQQQCAKQQNMYDQTTSRAGENYKFEMDLDVLAGGATAGSAANDPNILRRHSYAGCWITKLDGPEMNYQNADGIEFSIGIRFDNVVTFDNYGVQMGTFSHTTQINNRQGISTTGIGSALAGININTNSINVATT